MRVNGQSWTSPAEGIHTNFLETLRSYLTHIDADGFFYLEHQNVTVVNRRFSTVKS